MSLKFCFLVQLCILVQLQHLVQFEMMDRFMLWDQSIHFLWYCFQMQDERDWTAFLTLNAMFVLISSPVAILYPSNILEAPFGIFYLHQPFLGKFLSQSMLVCFQFCQWSMYWKDRDLHWFYHLCIPVVSLQIFQFSNSNQQQQLHILMDLWLKWP